MATHIPYLVIFSHWRPVSSYVALSTGHWLEAQPLPRLVAPDRFRRAAVAGGLGVGWLGGGLSAIGWVARADGVVRRRVRRGVVERGLQLLQRPGESHPGGEHGALPPGGGGAGAQVVLHASLRRVGEDVGVVGGAQRWRECELARVVL